MLHMYVNEFDDGLDFWCNCAGDLFHDGKDIDSVEELPLEVKRAYEDLWTDDVNDARCYVVEYAGRYGIALEAEYDHGDAEYFNLTYGELIQAAKRKASDIATAFPEFEVIFGKDTMYWSDGSFASELYLFMPWDIKEEDFGHAVEKFGSMCYDIPKGKEKFRYERR